MKIKGQIAMEFLWFVGIGMLLLAIFLVLLYTHYQEELLEKRFSSLEDLGITLQDELILASQVHEGYYRAFIIPEEVERNPISIFINNTANVMFIEYRSVNYSFRIPSNTTGSFEEGTENVIQQDDGIIRMNP
tara:strand:- start:196 stop:594 length:399 start_codon:yes stop_codon:yes gene_type:complete